jgi:hypothetical protein
MCLGPAFDPRNQLRITVKKEREVKLFGRVVKNTGMGQRIRFLRLSSGGSFHETTNRADAACEWRAAPLGAGE